MFPLKCKSQNYAWGKFGLDSLVGQIHAKHNPDLSAEELQKLPFAEFWMGDHPNGPSMVKIAEEADIVHELINDQTFIDQYKGQEIPISTLYKHQPTKFLGQAYLDKFSADSLAFLFKVLSVRTALSIQAHPNKALAEKLHVQFPDKYKDPNHKPEIAIALTDNFVACYGFASSETIQANLNQNPKLGEIFPVTETPLNEAFLRASIDRMFNELDLEENTDKRTECISQIAAHIETLKPEDRSEHQNLCMQLVEQYGTGDIGILFSFLFNILRLKVGESFVISPDEPHAYISGDLIEAMVSSDNVVRGGLTPKFKDTKTLQDMLIYEFRERKQNSGEKKVDEEGAKLTEYPTGYQEFKVTHVQLDQGKKLDIAAFNTIAIAVVISGSATTAFEHEGAAKSLTMEDKTAYFIMPGYALNLQATENCSIFISSCDV